MIGDGSDQSGPAAPSMALDLATALRETNLRHARVVAGERSLERPLGWVHMVDHPDIINWVRPGQLLLTTGYHWPDEPESERALVVALAEKGLAGVALAVPRFLTAFPETSRQIADELDFPLLEIPWDVPFSQITEEIHAWLIARQGQWIARAERIHRDLTRSALTARSLGDIAGSLSLLLERDVLFTGADGEWLGGSGGFSDRHLPTSAMRLSVERLTERPSRSIDGDGYRLMACPIRIHDARVATLWIDETGSPVSELEQRAAEQAALIAALHLSHQQALHAQEARLGYAFVDSLLEGRFESSPAALERAALSGWDISADYRVCAILLNEPVPLSQAGLQRRERWERKLRQTLRAQTHPALISVSLNQLIFLLRDEFAAEGLWRQLSDGEAAMAVSRVVRGPESIARGAADVASLMPALKPGECRGFEALLFTRVLQGDAEARRHFLDRISGALSVAGTRGEMGLETLTALADHGFQLAQTARALGLHISTLRYRLGRLQAALEMDLDDPDVRLQLQVAARLLALET